VRNCVLDPGHFPYDERDAETREDLRKINRGKVAGWRVVLFSQATFRSSVGACQSVPRWMNDSERDERLGKKRYDFCLLNLSKEENITIDIHEIQNLSRYYA